MVMPALVMPPVKTDLADHELTPEAVSLIDPLAANSVLSVISAGVTEVRMATPTTHDEPSDTDIVTAGKVTVFVPAWAAEPPLDATPSWTDTNMSVASFHVPLTSEPLAATFLETMYPTFDVLPVYPEAAATAAQSVNDETGKAEDQRSEGEDRRD
jgi:hypothetical protein